MNTKEKILTAALDLFNSYGVERTTTRHIAKSIAISQGNLHYHYPNRNEVITALFIDFGKKVSAAQRYDGEKVLTPTELLGTMKDNYTIMYQYRFLFKDNEVIWRRIPSFKGEMQNLFGAKKKQIIDLILHYKSEQIFRQDMDEKQVNFLADHFITSISTWLIAIEYLPEVSNPPEYFTQFTFRMWLPYLTSSSISEWEKILLSYVQ